MTIEQRQSLYERAFADLMRRGRGYVLFSDAAHGDNYVEVGSDLKVEVSHRRWPACKLPPLAPEALQRLDRLGFKETERNPACSFEGWSFSRMGRHLESVFLEVYACPPEFDIVVETGD